MTLAEFKVRYPLTVLEYRHEIAYPYIDNMIAVGREKMALDRQRQSQGIPSIFG